MDFRELVKRRNHFDDGSVIQIKGEQTRGGKEILIAKKIYKNKFPKAKYITLLLSSNKKYLAIEFSNEEKQNSYPLREYSLKKERIQAAVIGKFRNWKYFEKDIKWEKGLLIIEVSLKENIDIFPEDLEEIN